MANKALAQALKTAKTHVKTVEPVDEDVRNWVESQHKVWQNAKDEWQEITFDTRENLEYAMAEARRYTNEIREPRLTIQQSGQPEETPEGVRVIYRVRDKTGAGRPKGSKNGSSPAK